MHLGLVLRLKSFWDEFVRIRKFLWIPVDSVYDDNHLCSHGQFPTIICNVKLTLSQNKERI
jgi:hypothetical protein